MPTVREDNLSGEATRALLALHLAGMHANSPPGSVFALDLSGLQSPDVTVWTAWEADPALTLCRKRGFVDGAPFSGYTQSPFHRFLHLTL